MDKASFPRITVLDVGRTHYGSLSSCRMRLLQKPNGNWYCLDCGFEILHTEILIKTFKMCKECAGKGYAAGCMPVPCADCNGTGVLEEE